MRRYAMHIYDLKRNFVNNSSKEDNEPSLPFRERGKKKKRDRYHLISIGEVCIQFNCHDFYLPY